MRTLQRLLCLPWVTTMIDLLRAAADLWTAAADHMAPGAAASLAALSWSDVGDFVGIALISYLGARGMCAGPYHRKQAPPRQSGGRKYGSHDTH